MERGPSDEYHTTIDYDADFERYKRDAKFKQYLKIGAVYRAGEKSGARSPFHRGRKVKKLAFREPNFQNSGALVYGRPIAAGSMISVGTTAKKAYVGRFPLPAFTFSGISPKYRGDKFPVNAHVSPAESCRTPIRVSHAHTGRQRTHTRYGVLYNVHSNKYEPSGTTTTSTTTYSGEIHTLPYTEQPRWVCRPKPRSPVRGGEVREGDREGRRRATDQFSGRSGGPESTGARRDR